MQHEDKEANLIQGDEYLAKITVHNFIGEYTSRDENCSHKCVGLRIHPMCRCRLPLVKLCHMCGYVGLKRGRALGRGEAGGLWEKGSRFSTWGQSGVKVHTLH
jgi:hypothetical protein